MKSKVYHVVLKVVVNDGEKFKDAEHVGKYTEEAAAYGFTFGNKNVAVEHIVSTEQRDPI